MADAAGRPGQALRLYQILLILAVGWLAGRLPELMAADRAEEARLVEAMGGPAPGAGGGAAAAGPLTPDMAAAIAAQVADRTVAGLVAAGWGPRDTRPIQLVLHQAPGGGAGRPAEAVVRLVTEAAPARPATAGADWQLPPAAPAAPGGPPAERVADTGAAPPPPPAAAAAAHATATAGYAAIRAGDRREGARLLGEAVAAAPDAPQAAQWEADRRALGRRWSVAAYTLAREGAAGDPLAASPVLGGGQSGAAVSYRFNPYASRPVSAVARVTAAAAADGSIDREAMEAALGLRVQPLPGVPVALDVERRFALGSFARNAWALRLSGGHQAEARVAGARLLLEGYGETGMVGFRRRPDLYAGGQLRAAAPLFELGRVTVDGGAGSWAAAQRSFGTTASRLDVGPSARFRVKPWPFSAQVDYRVRAAGNALPGSGPVVTVSGEF